MKQQGMVRYRIEHQTHYHYHSPVAVAQQLVRLQPRALPWQRCLQFHLDCQPQPHSQLYENDYFDNALHSLSFVGAHDQLQLLAVSHVEVGPRPWANLELAHSPAWERVRALLTGPQGQPAWAVSAAAQAAEFTFISPLVPRWADLAQFARSSFAPGRPLLEATQELMERLHQHLSYVPGHTDSNSTVPEVWQSRRGVCQDFAHIMLTALRSLGLAARYVSGYLRTEPPAGQARLIGCDASHAWVAVWCPRWGWVEFDPTNNQRANSDYVVLAWGRDFTDVSPVRGVISGAAGHSLQVAVTVWPEPA